MFSSAFQCSHVVPRAYKALQAFSPLSYKHTDDSRLQRAITDVTTFDASLTRLFRSWVMPRTADGAIPRKNVSEMEIQKLWLESSRTHRTTAMWNFLKGARMILLQTLLELLDRSHHSSPSSPSTITSVFSTPYPNHSTDNDEELIRISLDLICQTAASIFATVSSLTTHDESRGPRNAGGYYLLWPLNVIISCKYTSYEDKVKAAEVLVYVGKSMGLRHALEIAEGYVQFRTFQHKDT